jgi:hypothetical protein
VEWIRLAKDMAPVNTAMTFGFLNWQNLSDLYRDSEFHLIGYFFSARDPTQTANRNYSSQICYPTVMTST